MPRQPVHSRRGTITGSNRLNQKAIKVLSAIKFSPIGMTREDIIEKTNLRANDIENQIRLLLQLNLITLDSRFPTFPQQGWRVYTRQEDHMRITRLLASHGIKDPRIEETRNILGDYYPTGLTLEGDGRQPSRGATYTKGHPVIPELEFRPEAIAVIKKFRDEKKPFQPRQYSPGAVDEKKEKWKWFVKEMSRAYNLNPAPMVTFGTFSEDSWSRPGSSGNDDSGRSSAYYTTTNTLFFTGRFSLVTLLHEFGHARGFDERDTIIWSINLGLRYFPVTFNRLLGSSEQGTHMLTLNNETTERFNL